MTGGGTAAQGEPMHLYGWCKAEEPYMSENKKGFKNWHAPKPHLVKKNEKDVGTFSIGAPMSHMQPKEVKGRCQEARGEQEVRTMTLTASVGGGANEAAPVSKEAINIFACDGVKRYSTAYRQQCKHPTASAPSSQVAHPPAGRSIPRGPANIVTWGDPLAATNSAFEFADVPSQRRSGQLGTRNLHATGRVHALPKNIVGGPLDPILAQKRGARNVYADI